LQRAKKNKSSDKPISWSAALHPEWSKCG